MNDRIVCTDEVCITCSDQLLTVHIVRVDGDIAVGLIDGQRVEVSVDLIDGAAAGDVVLAHGGVALQRADSVDSRP